MQWVCQILILAHQGHDHADGAAHNGSLLTDMDPWVPLAVLALGVLAAVAVLLLIVSKLRGQRSQHAAVSQPTAISVASLPSSMPPSNATQLEIYNMPMRLSLLVLAPVGRDGVIPASDQLPQVVDAVVPNLMQVLEDHQPEFRRWPPQLSSQGFSQMFFNNVPLPSVGQSGESGKNTPWCALAGRFDAPSGPMLAGIVCVAAGPNSIGQIPITQPGQWLDIVRVKA